jgi:hypothetical protein
MRSVMACIASRRISGAAICLTPSGNDDGGRNVLAERSSNCTGATFAQCGRRVIGDDERAALEFVDDLAQITESRVAS